MVLVPSVMVDIISVFVDCLTVLRVTVVYSHALIMVLIITSRHTPTATIGLYCVNGDTPVLLQTTQAYVYTPSDPACGMTIRLMLDGVSQRSYITESKGGTD